MTETTAEATPASKPAGILKQMGRAVLLLRESRIGMFGGFLVLFWVSHRHLRAAVAVAGPVGRSPATPY